MQQRVDNADKLSGSLDECAFPFGFGSLFVLYGIEALQFGIALPNHVCSLYEIVTGIADFGMDQVGLLGFELADWCRDQESPA